VPSEIGTFYGDYKTQAVSIERLMELIRPEPPSVLVESHPIYDRGPLPEVTFPVKTPADRLESLEVTDLSYRYAASENGRGLEGILSSAARRFRRSHRAGGQRKIHIGADSERPTQPGFWRDSLERAASE
jgi:hypothetical protein